jgi:hypothetical protein
MYIAPVADVAIGEDLTVVLRCFFNLSLAFNLLLRGPFRELLLAPLAQGVLAAQAAPTPDQSHMLLFHVNT